MYKEAGTICKAALLEFRDNVNDYLPDADGEYWVDWTLEDCKCIKNCIDATISTILGTCMANHVTYELTQAQKLYDNAFEKKNIKGCQIALNKCMKEFNTLFEVCKRIPTMCTNLFS